MKYVLRLLFAAALGASCIPAAADEVLVSAASSLTEALSEIGRAYTAANPRTQVRFNFAASGALRQQILLGAPVDVFAAASQAEMDAVQKAGHVEPGTRADFAANRLVLIAPARGALRGWSDLAGPGVRRVALSNPDSVPSGRYARETLERRGLWSAVSAKAVFGENVRQTLAYVAGGNVDAGLVFKTDAAIESRRVRVVATAEPGRDHAPIAYPAAVLSRAPNAAGARAFAAFLRGAAAQAILARHGFLRAEAAGPPAPSSPRTHEAGGQAQNSHGAEAHGKAARRRQGTEPNRSAAPHNQRARTPGSALRRSQPAKAAAGSASGGSVPGSLRMAAGGPERRGCRVQPAPATAPGGPPLSPPRHDSAQQSSGGR